jgi:histidinol dehydrogenase
MIPILDWSQLSERERKVALRRPVQAVEAKVFATAQQIIDRVRGEGDAALRGLTRELDGVDLDTLSVTESDMRDAAAELPG